MAGSEQRSSDVRRAHLSYSRAVARGAPEDELLELQARKIRVAMNARAGEIGALGHELAEAEERLTELRNETALTV